MHTVHVYIYIYIYICMGLVRVGADPLDLPAEREAALEADGPGAVLGQIEIIIIISINIILTII